MRTYQHLWQQEELSDVDIVLTTPQDGSSAQQEGTCRLAAFLGHSVFLSDSPFFKAQILRWQNKRPHGEAFDSPAADQAATGSPANKRPQLVLTLSHEDQQPAALAVLQTLYHVPPDAGLLSHLTQEQQMRAALLADMWQVPDAGAAAANMLAAAADGELSEVVTETLLAAQALPQCLEPVLRKVLLSLLGDLEAVWADDALVKQLLGLPLHAIKLLLSCDELKVASEDTVLYIVRRYVDHAPTQQVPTQRQIGRHPQ